MIILSHLVVSFRFVSLRLVLFRLCHGDIQAHIRTQSNSRSLEYGWKAWGECEDGYGRMKRATRWREQQVETSSFRVKDQRANEKSANQSAFSLVDLVQVKPNGWSTKLANNLPLILLKFTSPTSAGCGQQNNAR